MSTVDISHIAISLGSYMDKWIRRSGAEHAPGKISPRMSRSCFGVA